MGREFLEIFEEWADDYDNSVMGHDPQYKEVFQNYDIILKEVTESAAGNILEFGVGTGNLTAKLLAAGHMVFGVEPSAAMREIAVEKLPMVQIVDGDFLNFPKPPFTIDTIVSTYAFHHLTDTEKQTAVKGFAETLLPNGKVVFADTMFLTAERKQAKIAEAYKLGYQDLAEDLEREYYPIIPIIEEIFTDHNFDISFKQMNDFVWLIIATYK
ncbi:class I SAM-dependent DNA methyltransferase [Ornithinibacillus contaminans]|uniref:class I SAM-dependent DNA methyltransferase n=1 Tax=Ornithinibacillus contaminans TaxID=694055 RepID=UPI00064DA425|nr:class I SAM-dependent methyltransferase [Ornithinibacillus contaminans]